MDARLRRILALAAIVPLAGCDGVIVYEPMSAQRYSRGDFDYAARSGEMKTEVVGDPFGNTPGFAARVVEHMYQANHGPTVKFVLQPEGRGSAPFHVVMVFNPPVRVTGADACSLVEKVETARGADPVYLLVAFCSGDVVMSEASGKVGGVTGPDDPKFRSLVRAVTTALIPAGDRKNVGKP